MPPQVQRAVTLLWASWGLGLLSAFIDIAAIGQSEAAGAILLVVAIVFALIALLNRKIGKGLNWARITYIVLFVIGMPNYLRTFPQMYARSPLAGFLSLAQLVLQSYALYLLFTKPGSDWFQQKATRT